MHTTHISQYSFGIMEIKVHIYTKVEFWPWYSLRLRKYSVLSVYCVSQCLVCSWQQTKITGLPASPITIRYACHTTQKFILNRYYIDQIYLRQSPCVLFLDVRIVCLVSTWQWTKIGRSLPASPISMEMCLC